MKEDKEMNTTINTIMPELMDYTTKQHNCKGCENLCLISKHTFSNGKVFYSGNKCEKVYTNRGDGNVKGENHYNYKLELLNSFAEQPFMDGKLTIGIPRALNMWENFPFWAVLLQGCDINVVLSPPSTFKQYERGIGSVMSDNICFPAKLMHGHIHDLLEMKVDRILFPFVVYEKKEHSNVANSYNCPIVSGYSEVIKSSIDTATKYNIPLDAPSINFDNERLLYRACWDMLEQYGVRKSVFKVAFATALAKWTEYKNALKLNCRRIFENAVTTGRTVILVASRPYHTDQLIQHKLTDMIADFGVDIISDDIIREDDYTQFSELNTVSQWTYTNRILKAAQFVGQSEADMHFIEITSFGCGPDAFVVDEVSEILKSYRKNLTLLKVDDVSNIGSIKLRVRSLLESLKFRNANGLSNYVMPQTPNFTSADREKTILVPFFSEFYSPFVQTFFEMMGYKMHTFEPSDERSIEYGLKYANNEICYPATLVIGDIIRELESGKYDLKNVVIGMTQTGGQCRATNYIMLIKKAMIAAGYTDIPVISIAFSDGMNNQQEFKLDYKPLLKIAIYAAVYADSISKMYYSAAAHEKEKGQAKPLRDKYIKEAQELCKRKDIKGLKQMLHRATDEFNAIIDMSKNPPKIGIVGEIYVKYNNIGHKRVVNWLVEQNVEVVMPPILSFFVQYFVNRKSDVKHNLENRNIFADIMITTLHNKIDKIIAEVSKIASNYKLWTEFGDINEEAEEAEKIISLATQFGEGWLIPAEIGNFNKHNVQNVVSLQPFGCIANHIISKGIEKKIKQQFPNMNLLFLDFDSGVSDVNVHNRLHFMIKNAKENL